MKHLLSLYDLSTEEIEKILDLAIRGKLVPQDPNDEPASVLLERIRAEKEQLIKEGKIKRSKKSASTDKSHYENPPFEIPESWEWVVGGEVFLPMISCKPQGDEFKYIDIDSVDNRRNKITNPKVLMVKKAPSRASRYTKKGDVLFSMVRPYLKNIALVEEESCIASTGFFVCSPTQLLTSEYCYYMMLSDYVVSGLNQYMKGDNSPSINNSHITTWLYPIPPVSEQRRIVVEIQKWFKYISTLDGEKIELEASVNLVKSKILDLAISGKLVPQDPNDEPAIELLKRINPNFVPCDNSHYENIEFDIPKKWVWATIGDIFEHNTGKALNSSNPNGTMLDYITTSNLYWDRFELSIIKQMPFTESEIERCIVRKGDLLICEGGDVGRAAIWDYDYNIMIQNHIHRLRGKVDICTRYFFYLFMHYKLHNLIGGKGVAIQGLSSRDLHNLIIPVPSLKEQYDIASSIDLYFSRLDAITAEL